MGNTYRSRQFKRAKNYLTALSRFFHTYRARCRKRAIKFDITKDRFEELVNQDCYLCGAKPRKYTFTGHTKGLKSYLFANGIDRIDGALGYVEGNVRPCCSRCNSMKSDLSDDDFKNHIKKIYRKIKKQLTRPANGGVR
jgi:hypothetical protein